MVLTSKQKNLAGIWGGERVWRLKWWSSWSSNLSRCMAYSPENYHVSWKWTPGKGGSFWKPIIFRFQPLVFRGILSWRMQWSHLYFLDITLKSLIISPFFSAIFFVWYIFYTIPHTQNVVFFKTSPNPTLLDAGDRTHGNRLCEGHDRCQWPGSRHGTCTFRASRGGKAWGGWNFKG